jgi:predicted RNase H-like HicB family nuclease
MEKEVRRTKGMAGTATTRASRTLRLEFDRETDGRWIAEIPDLPGVMAYGKTKDEAISRVQALAFRVLAETLEEHGTSHSAVRFKIV